MQLQKLRTDVHMIETRFTKKIDQCQEKDKQLKEKLDQLSQSLSHLEESNKNQEEQDQLFQQMKLMIEKTDDKFTQFV